MSETPGSAREPLSATALVRLDKACDRFEAAWRAAQRPPLEDFLTEIAELERGELFRELLAVELACRRERGEHPTAEEYQGRFPDFATLVQAEFQHDPYGRQNPGDRREGAGNTRTPPADSTAVGHYLKPPSAWSVRKTSWTSVAPQGAGPLSCPTGYEILGELGRGGMGVVYKARHLGLNRIVALKMILAGAHASPDDLVRFLAEAEAVAHLQHPNIVQIFESGRHQGLPYFTLEFVPGGSLADKVREAPLPPVAAARLVEHMARGMAYAHERGVVHRDLKPENVLMAADGMPKITDFGLAKRVEGGPGLTQTGAIVGTPSYMAPEQAGGTPPSKGGQKTARLAMEEKEGVGPPADIYALGAVLYRLVTGRPPFQAATPWHIIQQVVTDEPVPVRQLQPHCPRDLETICHKCLQKDKGRRYPSAALLAEDLRRFQAGEPVQARAVTRWERGWKWVKRRPLAAGLAAVTLLLVLAVVAGLVSLFYSDQLEQALDSALREKQQATNAQQDAEKQHERARTQQKKAEEAQALADKERERAEAQKIIAENAQAEALTEAKKARQAEEEEKRQRDEAQKQRERAEALVYSGKIAQALSAWRENDVQLGRDLLHECRKDLRGWEHRYAWSLLNSNQRTLLGHGGPVICVAWSPNGRRLASSSEDRTLKIWNAETGEEHLTLKGHTATVFSVAWSPDGKRLASAGLDSTLKIWDAHSGKHMNTLARKGKIWGLPSVAGALAWSPDGKRLASASRDDTVKVWDTKTGNETGSFNHSDYVLSVAWSPDGKRLAGGCWLNTLKFWDAQTGQETCTLKVTAPVSSVAFSPDSKRLASATMDGKLNIWDAETGQNRLTLPGHASQVRSICWSPDGKQLASASWDHTLKVWDAQTGKEVFLLKGHTDRAWSVGWSPDGKHLASGSSDRTLKVWDVRTGQDSLVFKEPTGSVNSVAWSPDGKRLASASGSFGNTLKVWNPETSQPVLTIKGHTNALNSVAWSPDGKLLASGSDDGTLKVWDSRTGQVVRTLKGHNALVHSVAWSPDGKRLLSGSADKTLKLWDAKTGKDTHTLTGHEHAVYSVAWSHDGKHVVGCSGIGVLRVWNALNGEQTLSLQAHGVNVPVYAVAWSPDGKRLLSGSADQTLKLWDARSGKAILTLRGHRGRVRSVAWSPDGQRLASGSLDNTLKLWDAQTGQEMVTLKGHTAEVTSVAWSPDGQSLLTGSADSTLKVWEAKTGPPPHP
jgi:WD40 repeat protein/serine/threonine protein kinase